MKIKHLLVIIACLLFVGIAGSLISGFFDGSVLGNKLQEQNLADGALIIASLLILNVLHQYSTIRGTSYYRLLLFGVSITMIGVVFKIQHWQVASIFLALGLLGIPCVYQVWFIRKPRKNLLDWLKMLWVYTFFVSRFLIAQHLLDNDFSVIPTLLLILCFVAFWRQLGKKQDEIEFDFMNEKQDEQES